MIIYSYKCYDCNDCFDRDFDMGKAPSKVKCTCGSRAQRFFTPPSVKILNPGAARIGRGKG